MLKRIVLGIVLFAGLLVGTAWGDEALNKLLLGAVAAGDKAQVGTLIAQGADVNAKGYDGQTPLMIAARYKQKEVAELLIGHGADVNARDSNGMTPLHAAVTKSYNKDIVELLIAKGADINAKTNDGTTPLSMAIDVSMDNEVNGDVIDLLLAKGAK
jgi:ankyrin repeat protein